MLLTSKYQRVDLISSTRFLETAAAAPTPATQPHSGDHCPGDHYPGHHYRGDHANLTTGWSTSRIERHGEAGISDLNHPDLTPPDLQSDLQPSPKTHPREIDPLYLFACHLAWEQHEEPSAAWELLAAARCSHADTRAHARSLLASSRHLSPGRSLGCTTKRKKLPTMEDEMNTPYGLEIIDNCSDCTHINASFFCGFSSETALQSLSDISHKSVLPAGAILFVEGQSSPRDVHSLLGQGESFRHVARRQDPDPENGGSRRSTGHECRDFGHGYELTAETATPCQLNFVERKHFLELMQAQSEVGMHDGAVPEPRLPVRLSRHSRPCSYPLLRGKAGEAFAVKFTDPGSGSG